MKFNVSITMRNTTTGYELRAANLAPRLADALEQALATVAERDAEIARLRAGIMRERTGDYTA